MRKALPPWAWTAGGSVLLAGLVAGAGIVLSRRVEHVATKPPGNRVEDTFRETVRRLGVLEDLWAEALEGDAQRMLDNGYEPDAAPSVTGVVQASWLNSSFSEPARVHRRFDGSEMAVKPVLERFARGDTGEWVFTDQDVLNGNGWIEQPNRPLAWRQGNSRTAVVLLLDPTAAAATVKSDLIKRISLPVDEPGKLSWEGPMGAVWLSSGNTESAARPDEIFRHVSRFGDWTLKRHYPVRVAVSYRMPVLAGSLSIAALLLGGGVAIVSWQRKAIRLAEERVSFVNQVSHELRTPLTNLLLNADLALDGLPVEDGKVRRRLGLIREETSRLSRIVDNVLAFARIEKGTAEYLDVSCDPDEVLGEIRENFAPLFERKSIVCDYDQHLEGEVILDRDAFSQILSNLLSNVEKYAGEGAKAAVRFPELAGYFVVDVEDDGPGIPAEARKRVFLPFERGGSRVNEGASGTGLGLAISRELAERMGGRLELVHSDRGARFRLMIPFTERRSM